LKERKAAPAITVQVAEPETPAPKPTAAGGGKKVGAWEQKMQAKADAEYDQERAKIRERRAHGAQHVDEQIRKLITEMRRLASSQGQPNPPGVKGLCASLKFGDLFAATQGSMSELSATLNQARKRGVVQFEGHMLQQGFDDEKLLTLVKDQIDDSEVFKSKIVRPKKEESVPSTAPCTLCGKTVYVTERLLVNKLVFHKGCFKCSICSRVLKLAEYSFVSNKYFCKPCFMKAFQKSGKLDF